MSDVPNSLVRILKGHSGPVYFVKFNKEGTYCMTGGQDRTIHLWNPHRNSMDDPKYGMHVKKYDGVHGYDVQDVDITKDNAQFCSCGRDKFVLLWDVASGKIIRKFEGHEQRINAVLFNENDSILLSASYDKTVRAWDMRARNSYAPIQILDDFTDSVTDIKVTNHEIIASSVDGFVRIYDLRAGVLREDEIHDPVTHVQLSYDQNCILATCLNSSICLLEKENGSLLNRYKGHQNNTFRIASCISNTDAFVLGGSEDGRVYAWDLVDGNVLSSWYAHAKPISSIIYHPKQAMCLTSSHDGLIKVWKTKS